MRVALVGAGKRMLNVYVPLLKRLEHEIVGFTTRSGTTARRFADQTNLMPHLSIASLRHEKPDYMLVCVAGDGIASCLKQMMHPETPTLVETPIYDLSLAGLASEMGASVGVLEQWPFLPLEQFKQTFYSRDLIKRPYLVVNDCRSLDYHAIAQLRTYLGRHLRPVRENGFAVNQRLDAFEVDGVRRDEQDSWDVAQVLFEDGSILSHQFSYACKVAPFRSMQTLRAFSSNGTIVTGKKSNETSSTDYDILDIKFVLGNSLVTPNVKVILNEKTQVLQSISSGHSDWVNSFASLMDDELSSVTEDQGIAIMNHLSHMDKVVHNGAKPLYDLHDASMDQFITLAIKKACSSNATIQLQ